MTKLDNTLRTISPTRFQALAGYARQPATMLVAEEIDHGETPDGRLVACLIRDLTDNDYAGVIFARDKNLRFRCVGTTKFHPTIEAARDGAVAEAARLQAANDEEFHQGDETGKPIDFFTPVRAPEKLNSGFLALTTSPGYSPARGIVEPMMRWYEDADGNFIEQFQTAGFDARMWELYLYATFIELGYFIDRSLATPDFCCSGPRGEFCVEASTVNPTRDATGAILPPPPLDTDEQQRAYLCEYMPIKYGSALTSKLAKKYWDLPHVQDVPLLFAVQDFSSPGSMARTRTGLTTYLYGHTYGAQHNDGALIITPKLVKTHTWGEKTIPSGFFALPGAENVSAVLFNSAGTIAKFNRMGVLARFGDPTVKLVRIGTRYDKTPNSATPVTFKELVGAPGYHETWVEGLDVFHNPSAKHPLPFGALSGAMHHRLRADGQIESVGPPDAPFGSYTVILDPTKAA